jgi:hypothetical protein
MAFDDLTVLSNGDTLTATHVDEIRNSLRADAHGEFDLGGSKVVAIPFGGGAQDAVEGEEFVVPTTTEGGFTYKVVVQCITQNASTTVTPRLYNVTDSTVAWTGSAGTATAFGSAAEQVSSAVTLAAGKRYALQFTKSNDTYECWGYGKLRRTYA